MSRRSSCGSSKRRRARTRHESKLALYHRPLRLEPLEDRRLLALVTVTTPLDTIDFNDGVTSLREAIFATNTVPGADTINFAPRSRTTAPPRFCSRWASWRSPTS